MTSRERRSFLPLPLPPPARRGFRGSGICSRISGIPLLLKVNRGSTFSLRRSTLDFCLGGQRSLRAARTASGPPAPPPSPSSTPRRDFRAQCQGLASKPWRGLASQPQPPLPHLPRPLAWYLVHAVRFDLRGLGRLCRARRGFGVKCMVYG